MIRNLFTLFVSCCVVIIAATSAATKAEARNGANISITSGAVFVDDQNGLDYKVGYNSTYTFTVEMESDTTITGATLGFVMYSPDGSLTNIIWNSVPANIGPWGDMATWNFGGPRLTQGPDGFNGSLPSAWLTGGVATLEAGYGPIGPTAGLEFTITLPGVDGGILCIDSAFFPPGGEWLGSPADSFAWAGGGGDLSVGGARNHAFCVTATRLVGSVSPACPSYTNIHKCDTLRYQAFTADSGLTAGSVSYSVTTTGNGDVSIDTTGYVTYIPDVSEIGEINITATATQSNGLVATCETRVSVQNSIPFLVCPPNVRVAPGSSVTTQPAVVADADACDSHVFTLESVEPTPSGVVTVDSLTGAVTFDSDSADLIGAAETDYTICLNVSDGVDSSSCCMSIKVQKEVTTCITIDQNDFSYSLDGASLGEQVEICVKYEGGATELGGFDFSIAYDSNALSIVSVTEGNIFPDYGWERFTSQTDTTDSCCPSGLIHLEGLADVSGDSHTPSNTMLVAGDKFACLTFQVSDNTDMVCNFAPISWRWNSCTDNSLISTHGDTTYISRNVYQYAGSDVSNVPSGFRHDLTGLDQTFPTITGAPDLCDIDTVANGQSRLVDYKHGGVKIFCPPFVDNGDVNLNGISYEIADYVVLTNYFVNGIGAFSVDSAGQTEQSDVNCDGIPLSVADLVYIQRVITGSDKPCRFPVLSDDTATFTKTADVIATNRDLGAVFFVLEGDVTPTLLASNMEMATGMLNGNTRVLIHDNLGANEFIHTGPVLQTEARLLSVDASDTSGATVQTVMDFITDVNPNEGNSLPRSFALKQNYPNPFNPSTTISVDFPQQSEYTLTFYNIRGQKVAEYHDTHSPGVLNFIWEPADLPSGVYLYKFQAEGFTATKKLVLLK